MADIYETNQFRKGLKIEVDGDPWMISDFQHVKPGKGNTFTRTRLKNLITGRVLERTFKSGETVAIPDVEQLEMQYLYREGSQYTFMDTSTYDQVALDEENLGDGTSWLKESITVQIVFYRGKPISVELPNFVELEVTSTEPGIRGDTAQGAVKPAKFE